MNSFQQTRMMLLRHAEQYPKAELQDYMKFIFQSAFGCEHLVADPSAAADRIRREALSAVPHTGTAIEPLDGPYARVHLDILRTGLTADTLAALFVGSAEHIADGPEQLEEKLTVFRQMLSAGDLPGDPMIADMLIGEWKKQGYPACHHSETFRKIYAPAYRLLKASYVGFLPLFAEIDRRLSKEHGRITVAIDGNCGSGKTTLAALLHSVYGCNLFHMDDFFLRPEQRTPERYAEPGGNVDRERFLCEVLHPVCAGETVRYQPFDCRSMSLLPATEVSPTELTVVEGSYSLHPALRDSYTLRVFLRTDPETQIRRIRARNGEAAVPVFLNRWIPLEQAYHDACHPEQACEFVFRT